MAIRMRMDRGENDDGEEDEDKDPIRRRCLFVRFCHFDQRPSRSEEKPPSSSSWLAQNANLGASRALPLGAPPSLRVLQ